MNMSYTPSISYGCPCAACKFLRRKCVPDCIFAPHFPPEEHKKFANIHKIFGTGNVTKLLSGLPPHLRDDAVNSLSYEAEARVRDPVYGCVGDISFLQSQVERLQKELDAANASLIRYSCNDGNVTPTTFANSSEQPIPNDDGVYNINYPCRADYTFPYPLPWSGSPNSEHIVDDEEGGGN